MDALKLIPQLFFDAIGRIVPGGVAFALWLLGDSNSAAHWKAFLQNAQGLKPDAAPSSAFVLATLIFGSYVVGHLVSPLTKGIQRIGEQYTTWERKRKAKKAVAPALTEAEPGLLSRSAQYEWLRMHAPDAGAHCAKLRAEFTMYNSLSAVFLLALLATPLASPRPSWIFIALLPVGVLAMASRGRDGVDTFDKSVRHFYRAAREKVPSRHVPFRQRQADRSKAEA